MRSCVAKTCDVVEHNWSLISGDGKPWPTEEEEEKEIPETVQGMIKCEDKILHYCDPIPDDEKGYAFGIWPLCNWKVDGFCNGGEKESGQTMNDKQQTHTAYEHTDPYTVCMMNDVDDSEQNLDHEECVDYDPSFEDDKFILKYFNFNQWIESQYGQHQVKDEVEVRKLY